MSVFQIIARFADAASAESALRRLTAEGLRCRVAGETGKDRGRRETRFMGRIVILIALWSFFGSALGAGLGLVIAMLFGPEGTQGMIIQAVSWAIFAHLLGGMWAGYWLLADRSRADLPIPGNGAVLLVVECASIDDTGRATARLRELGAAEITSEVPAASRQGGRDGEQVRDR